MGRRLRPPGAHAVRPYSLYPTPCGPRPAGVTSCGAFDRW